ncbi:MAG: DUF3090 family protein [Ilumatobacteraceae bacterium]|jgi:uncharacterized repeat protein (TIGR03847 family)|nr:DUF3090 family protein [Actinomycetota bacterium]MDA3011944.1 DUF3090 family protein [Actinomycetota bacterium]MDA3024634.1 DUF3090 family protein [Actinomycetota bacterium]NBU56495.1 DUF3090 family protein [Acidimicrobiia bacterium]
MGEIVFDSVDVFTTGTVGRPGQRTFFLQARDDDRVVSVRCEKQQAAAIAQYLRRALAHLPIVEGTVVRRPMSLVEPVDEEFVLGSVGLEFDKNSDRFTLRLRDVESSMADELDDESDDYDDTDDDYDGDSIRVTMSRAQALAFCDQTDRVVAAGRPDCEFCGRPVDSDGHFCVRMN